MNLSEKIAEFRKRQFEIVNLSEEIKPKQAELQQKFKEECAVIEKKYQDLDTELTRELDNKRATYRAELKAFCGITDGEKTNVLDVIEMILKLKELA